MTAGGVPAFDDSEQEALEYAIRCQRNRRNLTAAEIRHCVAELDKRKTHAEAGALKGQKPAQHCAGSGKSSAETAELLGVSPSQSGRD